MTRTAFAYVRVSGRDQMTGDGPVRQEAAIRSYAAEHDIHIAQVYFETVCGDIETLERPVFLQMIGDVQESSPPVGAVIVERLDRLSRHLMTQESCINDFHKRGFTLLSADPAEFDLMASDPGRILIRQIFGAINQYDKAMTVAKLRAARVRKKAATGRCEGRKPFGSRPGESDIIQHMQSLRDEHYAYDRIAATLTAENVPTRNAGATWHGQTVKDILSRNAQLN